MRVIPAIDIKDGKVVRLAQGMADRVTVYSDDPVAVAQKWASYGVELIHVVDLDGAFRGELKNFEIIKKIAASVKVPIEVGGGIREIDTIEMALEGGVGKVCLGTKALDNGFLARAAQHYKSKIVVSIDAKNGYVYSKGWLLKTKKSALDLVREVENAGIRTINYTDISKDGMLKGPNIRSLRELLRLTDIDIVAGGGISSIGDVKDMKCLEKEGLRGIIIGKALYEDRIDLAEAVKICSQNE